jgi:hypothetical protein
MSVYRNNLFIFLSRIKYYKILRSQVPLGRSILASQIRRKFNRFTRNNCLKLVKAALNNECHLILVQA